LGPLQVRQYGLSASIPGAKPRAITASGGLINRLEMSEEADLDAALARFEQLDR
jgi:hypothetical protein